MQTLYGMCLSPVGLRMYMVLPFSALTVTSQIFLVFLGVCCVGIVLLATDFVQRLSFWRPKLSTYFGLTVYFTCVGV